MSKKNHTPTFEELFEGKEFDGIRKIIKEGRERGRLHVSSQPSTPQFFLFPGPFGEVMRVEKGQNIGDIMRGIHQARQEAGVDTLG